MTRVKFTDCLDGLKQTPAYCILECINLSETPTLGIYPLPACLLTTVGSSTPDVDPGKPRRQGNGKKGSYPATANDHLCLVRDDNNPSPRLTGHRNTPWMNEYGEPGTRPEGREYANGWETEMSSGILPALDCVW
jgi:hypothetical protein